MENNYSKNNNKISFKFQKKIKSTIILFFIFFISLLTNAQISSFPHTVDFESSSDLGSSSSDANSKWSSNSGYSGYWAGGELDFSRLSGQTPTRSGYSVITGPTTGYGGSGYYAYVESSSPASSGDDAFLNANYDLTNHNSSSITFKYHNAGGQGDDAGYGPALATIQVYNVTDDVWGEQKTISNRVHNDSWLTYTFDLSAGDNQNATYDGKSIQIWIAVDVIGYASDFAIDDISVTATQNVTIAYGASSYCADASDPSPTLTNNVGSGLYSSSIG